MRLLQRLFASRTPDTPPNRAPASRTMRRAAALLRSSTALVELSDAESLSVVAHMHMRRFAEGESIVRQGETTAGDGGFLALVVDGEVTVESLQPSRSQPLTVHVLGPGQMFGEVGLLDGDARSASCTASADAMCALLTRAALQQLIAEEPAAAAKLLVGVGQRLGQRLREIDTKFQLCHQLVGSMQAEIDRLTPE